MSFENPYPEIEPIEPEIEAGEPKPETFAEKSSAILSKVLNRIIETKDAFGEKMMSTDPEIWAKIKQTPFVRSIATAGEAVLGAEPGQKISSKEALVRSAVAGLMAVEDVFRLKDGEKEDENPFKGKTMSALSFLKDRFLQSDPQNPKGKAVEAIFSFLEKNSDIVSEAEEKINGFLKEKTAQHTS